MKTYEEINQRIKEGKAVVVTAEEVIGLVAEKGVKRAAQEVDVVTTATFAPMCSSGALLNFGHTDPPIRMTSIELNGVSAYGGLAAVDTYIGATQASSQPQDPEYGGAHVIEDLVSGKTIHLKASSPGTDCYPRRELDTEISLQELSQAYLHNPRNAYQNYGAAANTSARTLHTYMGTLLPGLTNVTYCSAGELSPLLNDPYYRTIGVGTRIFLGGGEGYVTWEGTQHNPGRPRGENGVPTLPAGTLSVTGDLKQMHSRFLRGAYYTGYGSTLFVGIGVPIPILDEEMMEFVSVTNRDIYTEVFDYAVARRVRPSLGQVNYEQLRSGSVTLCGKQVLTAPLSSLSTAREIAALLKAWVSEQQFLLTQPVRPLSGSGARKNRGDK